MEIIVGPASVVVVGKKFIKFCNLTTSDAWKSHFCYFFKCKNSQKLYQKPAISQLMFVIQFVPLKIDLEWDYVLFSQEANMDKTRNDSTRIYKAINLVDCQAEAKPLIVKQSKSCAKRRSKLRNFCLRLLIEPLLIHICLFSLKQHKLYSKIERFRLFHLHWLELIYFFVNLCFQNSSWKFSVIHNCSQTTSSQDRTAIYKKIKKSKNHEIIKASQ